MSQLQCFEIVYRYHGIPGGERKRRRVESRKDRDRVIGTLGRVHGWNTLSRRQLAVLGDEGGTIGPLRSGVAAVAGLLLVAAAFGCHEAHEAVKEEER